MQRRPASWRVAAPPSNRPILVYDADCGFCRLWIARWRERTGGEVDYAPSREVAARFPEIPPAAFTESVILIVSDGTAVSGAHAALLALATVPSGRRWIWLYRNMPGFAPAAEWCYRVVAGNRKIFSSLTRLLWGHDVSWPTWFLSRSLLIRLMGVIYMAAFVSLWMQIDGLVGSHGILPAAPWLDALAGRMGWERFWTFPTLAWFSASDLFLHLLCGGGAVVSSLVLLGIIPAPGLLVLWVLYLSLTVVCRVFLGFQWDNLLLEAGLIAIFLAPPGWRAPLVSPHPPSRPGMWLCRWLLFRLMFSSGVVKLSSGDPSWWNLTALNHYYETQPLPTWTAWYAHQMPGWFQTGSTLLMFAIELAAPFFIFGPRQVRHAAIAALIGLQVTIALTGNYGFFNTLTVALCLVMIDDSVWPLKWRLALNRARVGSPHRGQARWRGWVAAPLAAAIAIVGLVHLASAFRTPLNWPAPIVGLAGAAAPFRSVNPYGLFSIMTTTRPEIIVEGSDDGITWRPYEFRFKPGDPSRRPAFSTPHMPRLDWQMWFAALGNYRANPWFERFLGRLLEGSPQALALLETNPFPDHPPRQVRALLYEYRFTGPPDTVGGRAWWARELKGPYSPVLTLAGEQNLAR